MINPAHSLSDSETFHQRLAEAVTWCHDGGAHIAVTGSLRTSSLYPGLLWDTRASAVHSVLQYRCSCLRGGPVHPETHDGGLRGGRLLCYFPDADLCDGAAEVASDGFFDVHNTPPWDTWVGLFQDSANQTYGTNLVSYVPVAFLERAESGVDVNPEQCIAWLYDTKTLLSRVLRRGGWRF
jgi:hypothetical protein